MRQKVLVDNLKSISIIILNAAHGLLNLILVPVADLVVTLDLEQQTQDHPETGGAK